MCGCIMYPYVYNVHVQMGMSCVWCLACVCVPVHTHLGYMLLIGCRRNRGLGLSPGTHAAGPLMASARLGIG